MPVLQDPERRYILNQSSRPKGQDEGNSETAGQASSTGEHSKEGKMASEEELATIKQIKTTSSREELIQCIKRGEHPTWVPGRGVEATSQSGFENKEGGNASLATPETHGPPKASSGVPSKEPERSRSALHSGDFRQGLPERQFGFQSRGTDDVHTLQQFQPTLGTSPTTPWFDPPAMSPFRRTEMQPSFEDQFHPQPVTRSRAPSLGSSYSNSFIYRPPTSPLVYSASNSEVDFSSAFSATDKASRRRTLPPESFYSANMSPQGGRSASYSRPLPNLRRENSLPYQAHQPRRSLTSNTFQGGSGPVTPRTRSRGPSFSSDFSPLQHASMVGSYEESILRGRMSTTPSKPLDFVAQIGVLGKGNCKPSLRCPAHVTVQFPAVFYSYSSSSGNGRRQVSDDSPSPYVGNIDLEHNLKPAQSRSSKKQNQAQPAQIEDKGSRMDITAPENTAIGLQLDRRKREKQRRRSRSPAAPVGGCYRIPQQGQLQIIIKNPNKTAVKLFLVPYDLEGMQPGTKTFIRQRSYSHGPILDVPLSSASGNPSPAGYEKPTLRYLIHLRICCPSKGRFYLYDNIRVVFANRVPDGKEKLKNEIQLPEPRYSPWKANRDVSLLGSAGAKLAADNASRRRSSGFGGMPPFGFGDIDGLGAFEPSVSLQRPSQSLFPIPQAPSNSYPFPEVPPPVASGNDFNNITKTITNESQSSSKVDSLQSTPTVVSGFNVGSPITLFHKENGSGSESGESNLSSPYNKLRRQDGKYGSSERLQGLLAQRLKALDVQTPEKAGLGLKFSKQEDGDDDVDMGST